MSLTDLAKTQPISGSDDTTYGRFLPFLLKALGSGAMSGGLGSIGTLGLGAVQTIGSLINLNRLKREARPQYTISPELQKAYGMSEQRATQGFMPTEVAQFQQGLAGTLEAQRRNAIAMGGGGLSQAITGGLGGQALRSQNLFAAQDAERRLANERYFGSMAGQMQAQRNRMTQQDIAYRMAKEQAMGQALKAGTTNIGSAFNVMGMGAAKGLSYGMDLKNQYDEATKNIPEGNKPSFGEWFKATGQKKFGE